MEEDPETRCFATARTSTVAAAVRKVRARARCKMHPRVQRKRGAYDIQTLAPEDGPTSTDPSPRSAQATRAASACACARRVSQRGIQRSPAARSIRSSIDPDPRTRAYARGAAQQVQTRADDRSTDPPDPRAHRT
jgi:hypothetical protein